MLRVDINLLFTVINLLILFVAFKIFLFKPVQDIIKKRQELADESFNEAVQKLKEAEEIRSQYENSLATANQEKKEILAEARKKAEVEYQRILSDAEKSAEEVKVQALAEAENTKAAIIKAAEGDIANMVVDAAGKMVAKNASSSLDSALYDEFLSKAGKGEANE